MGDLEKRDDDRYLYIAPKQIEGSYDGGIMISREANPDDFPEYSVPQTAASAPRPPSALGDALRLGFVMSQLEIEHLDAGTLQAKLRAVERDLEAESVLNSKSLSLPKMERHRNLLLKVTEVWGDKLKPPAQMLIEVERKDMESTFISLYQMMVWLAADVSWK